MPSEMDGRPDDPVLISTVETTFTDNKAQGDDGRPAGCPGVDGHSNPLSASASPKNGGGGGVLRGAAVCGTVLSAHNIGYSVPVRKGCCGTEDKQILTNVTAIFRPGISAIMGSTGSGKSSFLDLLAGRKDPKLVTGEVLINGKPTPENFKCMVGYVVQDDVVMGTLTVRENLAFSAALRLPTTVSSEEKDARVEEVIVELGLTKCADTKVGTAFIRGVSGGERKRCNIGMELITSPPVLFLDEPTTGLDAHTANSVILFLKQMSTCQTIIMSIHQPRYSIYTMFDTLVLLDAGKTVYHGPAPDALEFFSDLGYTCQPHNNPPDFFLDVILGDVSMMDNADDCRKHLEIDRTQIHKTQHELLVAGFNRSRWCKQLNEVSERIYSQQNRAEKPKRIEYATSFGHQIAVVTGRSLRNLIRNPQTTVITFMSTLVFAVIIGAIFWQLEEKPETGFSDRAGLFFFLAANQLFNNMSAVEIFIVERKQFIHENVSGFYRVSVYFLVKIFADMIPLRLIPVMTMSVCVYFASGLNSGADHFFLFFFILFSCTLTAASMCFLYSSLANTFSVGQLLLSVSFICMLLLGGFLTAIDSIGPWLNWAQYLSILRYGLQALYINEFKDREFCSNSTFCQTGNAFLEQQDVDYKESWDFWVHFVALYCYTFILLVLTYVRLRVMKKTS